LDIDSIGPDMIQGTISAIVWRGHGKTGKLAYTSVGMLNGIWYFRFITKAKEVFSTV
jgi:hypothetical protein